MIQAENITKSFGSVQVLQCLDLQVTKGELIAIMGKSGSGKSTLLHILGTLDKADSGMLKIAGKNPNEFNEDRLAEFRNKEIGFVFQFHHLLPEFNLLENISMPGYIAGDKNEVLQSRAAFLLDYFGLKNQVNNKPAQLSGGEQQRGAICRALFNEPSIILADEPTGNLDQQNAEEFHRLIRKLSTDFDQTFIIVTHQADLADQCDKVMILESGKLRIT
ncbi:MAG: ABC transporter ATP-binding protein [Saprospiraceae bacterium]|nr:ABC transporter ATP-binding protein [Saprospiraceae bacterium]